MVAGLTLVLLLAQTGTYADRETEALVARARARHAARSVEITRYTARVFTRIDMTHARSRFGRQTPLGAVEYEASVDWSRDGGIRVEYVGLRKKYGFRMLPGPIPFFDIDQDDLDDPRADDLWFLPHRLGDEIWLVCCDFQERPALHPLAAGAERFYRYAIGDSLRLDLPERTVDVVAVDVVPLDDRRELILGRMWIEVESGDVVRFVLRLVGDQLFDDRRGSIVNRVFNAEGAIEYALVDGFWLPSRQYVTLEADDPWITRSVMPLRFRTEFRDYTVETGPNTKPVAEEPPSPPDQSDTESEESPAVARAGRVSVDIDELRDAVAVLRRDGVAGSWSYRGGLEGEGRTGRTDRGRGWRLTSPSLDSLERFDKWQTPLRITNETTAEDEWRDTRRILTELAHAAPDSVQFDRGQRAIEYGEVFRFNRVQGVAPGGGYLFSPPSTPFLTGEVNGRLGLEDRQTTLGITLTWERPSGSRSLRVGRFLEDGDPFVDGSSFGNSMNAVLTGHDDADYYLAEGGRVRFAGLTGAAGDWSVALAAEHHRSMVAPAGDRPNPAVRDGWWGTGTLEFEHVRDAVSVQLGTQVQANGAVIGGRAWTRVQPVLGNLSIALLGGAASRNDIPQLQWRAGGAATVRGYDYGTRRGPTFWAVQTEFAFSQVPRAVPVVFADVGNAGRPGDVFSTQPLVGLGVGIAFPLLLTELRLELSKAVGRGTTGPLRFDIRLRS